METVIYGGGRKRGWPSNPRAPMTPPGLPADAASLQFFQKEVRPLLETHCPSATRRRRSRAACDTRRRAILQGGDLGPVVKLDAPEQSLLLGAIGYTDDHLRMPPKGKLPPEAVATLTKWVQTGLPFSGNPLFRRRLRPRPGERCCKSEVVLVVPAGEAAGRAGRGGDAVGAQPDRRVRPAAGENLSPAPEARPARSSSGGPITT